MSFGKKTEVPPLPYTLCYTVQFLATPDGKDLPSFVCWHEDKYSPDFRRIKNNYSSKAL